MLLAVFVGNGIQLLCMASFTLLFAMMGFLNSSRRELLIMALLIFYVLMGDVDGYGMARVYESFKGKSQQNATVVATFGFLRLLS